MSGKTIDYETYKDERQFLSELENSNYENYEKTILTLSSAFLAFSVSFLGILPTYSETSSSLITVKKEVVAHSLLIYSWVSFSISVIAILLCFLVSALAIRKEVEKLELGLADATALTKKNRWSSLTYILYFISGVSFLLGLVWLVMFSGRNIFLL